MKKIKYNYHSHTYRCGHAIGNEEDYVLKAIEYGLIDYGVSDHVILPNVNQPTVRGSYDELEGYISSINNLKEKYKDKINIYTGFECEYSDVFLNYYKDLLNSKKVDYLILGQHCTFDDNYIVTWYGSLSSYEAINRYTDDLIKAMSTGLFLYVAHPDLFTLFIDKWDDVAKNCAKRIIDASIKYDVPLEINLCHARENGFGSFLGHFTYIEYPFYPFWEMVKNSKAKVVIGFDSHRPIDILYPGHHIIEDTIKATGVKPLFNFKIKKDYFKKPK